MIKIENQVTYGWEAAIRGMRNPMNSWDKSDSEFSECKIGYEDLDLMQRLAINGPVHAKYRRMITVTCDITAPLYWWKEFDTYKVGTVANSCSTMHKIHSKPFELSDFSAEHLTAATRGVLSCVIGHLNFWRDLYNNYDATPDVVKGINECYAKKDVWWQMIQLLPSSYNQKRTVQLNYEVLAHMHHDRRNHKLDEWRIFCDWIEQLPYAKEIITIK